MPDAYCSSNPTWLQSQGAIAIKTCFIVATMTLKPDTANQACELEKKFKNDMHSLIENELKKTGRLCEQDPYVREKRRLREEYHANLQSLVQQDKPNFIIPLGFLTITGKGFSNTRSRSRSRSRPPVGEVPSAAEDKVIKHCELAEAIGWGVLLQTEVENEMLFSDAMQRYLESLSGGPAPENKCGCPDNDNDQCQGPWCGKNTTLFDAIKHSMLTRTTQVNTLTRIGEGKEDEFKKSISTICFAIDWLMCGACDNAYAPLAEKSMTHLWNMSNKITDSWMDHWKDNLMYIHDKDFIDSFDTSYDSAKFKEKKMWNKISSSWTKFLEIKVFSRILTIDMSAINVFLTNLIDILFLAQGIMEMQAKHMNALSIRDSFDDTYREMYKVACTIKSCLDGKIVLRHNCTCDRMPGKRSRTFASTRMLFELKEKKELEKKQKAQKKYIKSKIETWRSSSSFGNDEEKTMK
jgi:hypothetical protein